MQNVTHLIRPFRHLLLGCLLSLLVHSAHAGVQYGVSIDTQALAGTTGYLDFGMVGLVDSPTATASITQLSGGNPLGAPLLDGEAAAQADGWTLGNGAAFNAVLQGWEFGGVLSFLLDFDGDWLTASGSGTTFALKLWDDGFNLLLSKDATGDLLRIELIAGGETAVVPLAADDQAIRVTSVAHSVPEPGALLLVLAALGLMNLHGRRRG